MNTKPKRKLTKREASLLGTAAARPVIEKLKQERITEYNKNPLLCKNCGNPIPYEKKVDGNRDFCSHSCSATYNNKRRPPKTVEVRQKISDTLRAYHHSLSKRLIDRKCKRCGNPVPKSNWDFCSIECYRLNEWETKKAEMERTGCALARNNGETDARNAKKFLEEKTGRKCSQCGASELNGKPIPLQLHHIDGDAMNSRLENLVLLCPTCHAMTDNFSGKNNHKSTRVSRKRYWSTKEDRKMLEIYKMDQKLFDQPASELPLADMREDLITEEDRPAIDYEKFRSGL